MRSWVATIIAAAVVVTTAAAVTIDGQEGSAAYLRWSAEQARRIGEAGRVAGRVGRALDLRGLHTDRAYNYKLRATWLSPEVIRATARLAQIADRLTDAETEALVSEAASAGDIVVLIEIDPREGSGVIPREWAAFLGPTEGVHTAVRGTSRPELEKVKALRGVYRRDYNYEQFWVVFPAVRENRQSLFAPADTSADLTVRILDKEGHVSFKVPR